LLHKPYIKKTPCSLFLIIALAIVSLTLPLPGKGKNFPENEALGRLFQKHKITGAMIITNLEGSTGYAYNPKRLHTRFLPASTFKILNTLIALDSKVIKDENEVIKWDGKDRGWKEWNRDQTLKTAFSSSCVWFYQELARRIGNDTYLKHLKTLEYGNQMTGPRVDTFWLNGDIAISPYEQITFLKMLYGEQLPYAYSHTDILKKIMIVDKTPNYTIRAKTGWTMRVASQVGWYVGYLENSLDVWFFALNIDIKNKEDARHRKGLTMEALELLGLLK